MEEETLPLVMGQQVRQWPALSSEEGEVGVEGVVQGEACSPAWICTRARRCCRLHVGHLLLEVHVLRRTILNLVVLGELGAK